jgi:hypothetical protein
MITSLISAVRIGEWYVLVGSWMPSLPSTLWACERDMREVVNNILRFDRDGKTSRGLLRATGNSEWIE